MHFVPSRHAVSKRKRVGGVVLVPRGFNKQLYCNSSGTCLQTVFTHNYIGKVLGLGNGTGTRRSWSNFGEKELGTELQTCFCGGFVLSLENGSYINRLRYLRLLADVLRHVKHSDSLRSFCRDPKALQNQWFLRHRIKIECSNGSCTLQACHFRLHVNW
jgi:hypothetical protein